MCEMRYFKMTYFELVEKYFNAWISTGNIDDSYADTDNIIVWLMDTDLWTEEDRSLLEGLGLPKEAIGELACDISDMVEEYIEKEGIL